MLRLLDPVHHTLRRIHGRMARPATFQYNLRKTLLQTMTMWLVFLCIGPLVALAVEEFLGLGRWRFASPFWLAVSVLLFVGGSWLASTSAWWMVQYGDGTPLPSDCPRRLAIAGPYRYVRNPMAMGSLGQGFAVGLALGSPLILLYALCGLCGWNWLVRPWEEHDLEQRFGEDYRSYKNAVRCWIPRLEPYTYAERSGSELSQTITQG